MRAVIQRVTSSSVTVDNKQISSIGPGLMVLLGVTHTDKPSDAKYLADKVVNLRIFEDQDGKMNQCLLDIGGEILVVSQFTLYGDCKKGRRPSFIEAASPDKAENLYEYFTEQIREKGIPAQSGQFRAMMKVELVNDGPVTLIIESKPMAS